MAIPPRFQDLDVLWQLNKHQIQNGHEAGLALSHCLLVGSGYRCVGNDGQLAPSTSLPNGWNDPLSCARNYSLMYKYAGNSLMPDLILVDVSRSSCMQELQNPYHIRISVIGGDGQVIALGMSQIIGIIPQDWPSSSLAELVGLERFTDTVYQRVVDQLLFEKSGQHAGEGMTRPQPHGDSRQQSARSSVAPVAATSPFGDMNPFAPVAPPRSTAFMPASSGIMSGGGPVNRDLDRFHGMDGNSFGQHIMNPSGLPGAAVGYSDRSDPPGPPVFMPGHGGISPVGDPMGTGPFPLPPGLFVVDSRIHGPRPFEPASATVPPKTAVPLRGPEEAPLKSETFCFKIRMAKVDLGVHTVLEEEGRCKGTPGQTAALARPQQARSGNILMQDLWGKVVPPDITIIAYNIWNDFSPGVYQLIVVADCLEHRFSQEFVENRPKGFQLQGTVPKGKK